MSRSQRPRTEELSTTGMRHRQKNRTRKLLLDAAAELVNDGREPTVAAVAEVGEVSRATAYRYFPTQESLLAEMRMFAPDGPIEMFDRVLESTDPEERVGVLTRKVTEWAFQNEPALRTWLRLSLDPSTGVRRPGHRIGWIAEALQPLQGQVDGATLDRLSNALTMLMGIDPIVPLTDFAGLPPAEAIDVIDWAARTLVRSVVSGIAPGAPVRTSADGTAARPRGRVQAKDARLPPDISVNRSRPG